MANKEIVIDVDGYTGRETEKKERPTIIINKKTGEVNYYNVQPKSVYLQQQKANQPSPEQTAREKYEKLLSSIGMSRDVPLLAQINNSTDKEFLKQYAKPNLFGSKEEQDIAAAAESRLLDLQWYGSPEEEVNIGNAYPHYLTKTLKGAANTVEGALKFVANYGNFGLNKAADFMDGKGIDSSGIRAFSGAVEKGKQLLVDSQLPESQRKSVGTWQIGDAVAEGVGNTATSAAMNLMIPGSGFPFLGASAAGNASEEALQDGAEVDKALIYGIASGATEVATELLFDSNLLMHNGVAFGRSIDNALDSAIGKFFKTSIGRSVANFLKENLEEGAEEYISEVVGEYLTDIYKKEQPEENFGDYINRFIMRQPHAFEVGLINALLTDDYLKRFFKVQPQAVEAGLVGALSSAVTNGLSVGTNALIGTNRNQNSNESVNQRVENQQNETNKPVVEIPSTNSVTTTNIIDNQMISNDINRVQPQTIENNSQQLEAIEGNGIQQSITEKIPESTQFVIDSLNSKNSAIKFQVEKSNEKTIQASAKQAGIVKESDIKTITEISNKTGVPVRFVDSLEYGADGIYKDGTIYISKTASDPAMTVFVHEMTHHIETSGLYNEFKSELLKLAGMSEDYQRRDIKSLAANVKRSYAEFTGNELQLDDAASEAEVIAKLAQEFLFKDESSIRKLAQSNRNLAQRIYDWIKETLSKFVLHDSPYKEQLSKCEKLYREAIKDAGSSSKNSQYLFGGVRDENKPDGYVEARDASKRQKMTHEERLNILPDGVVKVGDTHYNVKKSLKKQVKDVLNHRLDSNENVYLRETPEILVSVGLKKLPMLINQVHVETAIKKSGNLKKVNYHGMGKIFFKIPEYMENPLMVVKSKKKGRIVMLLNLADQHRDPIIVAIQPDAKNIYNKVMIANNHVTSVYGKNTALQYFENAFERNAILYPKGIKKAQIGKLIAGVQFPEDISQSGTTNNIARDVHLSNRKNPKKSSLDVDKFNVHDKIWKTEILTKDMLSSLNERLETTKSFFHKSVIKTQIDAIEAGYATAAEYIEQRNKKNSEKIKLAKEEINKRKTAQEKSRIQKLKQRIDFKSPEAHVEAAKKALGITYNYQKAGFINLDGTLLDLSEGGRTRSDHRVIENAFEAGERIDQNGTELTRSDLLTQYIKEGNIRFYPSISGSENGMEISKLPTNQQFDMIKRILRQEAGNPFFVDFSNENGEVIESKSYDKASGEILQDIKNHFNSNIKFSMPISADEALLNKKRTKSKSETVQSKNRRTLMNNVKDLFYVDSKSAKSDLLPIIVEMEAEYRNTGKIGKELRNKLFKSAWDAGRIVDPAYIEQYDDIREDIKGRKIKIDPSFKGDIPDFSDFKKRYTGILNFSNAGTPIDVIYQELRTQNPGIFDPEITHPADQLIAIMDMLDDIRLHESSLDVTFKDDPDFKEFVWNGLNKAVKNFQHETELTIRYEKYRNEQKQKVEETDPLSAEQIQSIYKEKQRLEKIKDGVSRKTLLNDKDRVQLDRLLKGEIEFSDLPRNVNYNGIKQMYDIQKQINDVTEPIIRYNKVRKQALNDKAMDLLKNSMKWTDKVTGLQYSRETMERNVRDITHNSEEAKAINDYLFKPIHDHEAAAIRFKNEFRDRVRKMKLTQTESELVQKYGEGEIKAEDFYALDVDHAKVEKAIKEFRTIYLELFDRINIARVQNGYAPMEFRKDYFPHFSEHMSLLAKIGKKLGMEIHDESLPTDIAGLTHTFRPGIKWFANALQRQGTKTAYDAVEGFNRYIEGAADIIYHTEDIQKLRAFEQALRYKHSDAGMKDEIENIRENNNLTDDEKNAQIDDLTRGEINNLGHFATELRSYTDNLAGKKSFSDRSIEQDIGRRYYSLATAMENRVASNMVALNPGSWLTNFIPITQASSQVSMQSMTKALEATMKNLIENDGLEIESTFLTNRIGSESLTKTRTQKVSETLAAPMQWIDEFTSNVVVRAKYYENLKSGMDQTSALADADQFAANLIADRSKGSMPTLFNRKNPITKIFTQFQLEQNNQLSYLLKDVPRDLKDKGLKVILMALLKYGIGAYLYNEIYGALTGRHPALDPGRMIKDAVLRFADKDKKKSEAVLETGKDVLEQVPFVGGLMGGGRLPINSALPNVTNVVNAGVGWASGEMNERKAKYTLGKELSKPAFYFLPPVAGGQIKKFVEGMSAIGRGGVFGVDSEGRDTLKYYVEPTFGNTLKSAVFGPTSTDQGKKWIESGFPSLSGKKTEAYKDLVIAGIDMKYAYEFMEYVKSLQSLKDANGNTIPNSKSALMIEKLEDLGLRGSNLKNYIEDNGENLGISSKIQEMTVEEIKKMINECKEKEGK